MHHNFALSPLAFIILKMMYLEGNFLAFVKDLFFDKVEVHCEGL